MNRTKRKSLRVLSSALGAFILAAGVTGAHAEDTAGTKTFRQLDGVSINVGSKRMVGYFLAQNYSCNLTLFMSDQQAEDEVPNSAARVRQVLAANSSARIDTAEGESLELACQPGASGMTVRLLKQVATFNPAK